MQARMITEDEALQRVTQYSIKSSVKGIHNVSKSLKLAYVEQSNDSNFLYVFNKGVNKGFIISSGDDRTLAVCGYSDEGTFDPNNIPPEMKWWLSNYVNQIRYINDNDVKTKAPTLKTLKKSVSPLLGDIMWNQTDPYNLYCPVDTVTNKVCPTGCVPVAFAMVMRYYSYPSKGHGSATYTDEHGVTRSVNFANSTYDWSKINSFYTPNSSQESKEAVAKLIYEMGIASKVNYSYTYGSGALTSNACYGLVKYFGYDPGMQYLTRNYCPDDQWNEILINEIDNHRPVIYGGMSVSNAHQFILDGYDTNGYYHINWGWGGISNGYYSINILNPLIVGTSGSLNGYNGGQDAVIGIAPAYQSKSRGAMMSVKRMAIESDTLQIGRPFALNLFNVYNYGYQDFESGGEVGVGLFNDDNQLVAVAGSLPVSQTIPVYGGNYLLRLTATIPSNIENDSYSMCMVQKIKGSDEYIKGQTDVSTGVLYVTKSDNGAVVTDYAAKLEVSNWQTQTLYRAMRGSLECSISNASQREYRNFLYLNVSDISTGQTLALCDSVNVDILGDATTDVVFNPTLNLPVGQYNVHVYDSSGKVVNGDGAIINILEPTNGTLCARNLLAGNNNIISQGVFDFSGTLTNTGQYFNGQLYTYLVSETTGVKELICVDNYEIDEGATINFESQGRATIAAGIYSLVMEKVDGGSSIDITELPPTVRVDVSTEDALTLKDGNDNIVVYPNPVQDILNIDTNDTTAHFEIFNLNGCKVMRGVAGKDVNVSHLVSGSYIIKIETDEKQVIQKLIKM